MIWLTDSFSKATDELDDKKDRLIAQFSSIGLLGSTENNWLCKEFYASLSTTDQEEALSSKNKTSKPICVINIDPFLLLF